MVVVDVVSHNTVHASELQTEPVDIGCSPRCCDNDVERAHIPTFTATTAAVAALAATTNAAAAAADVAAADDAAGTDCGVSRISISYSQPEWVVHQCSCGNLAAAAVGLFVATFGGNISRMRDCRGVSGCPEYALQRFALSYCNALRAQRLDDGLLH